MCLEYRLTIFDGMHDVVSDGTMITEKAGTKLLPDLIVINPFSGTIQEFSGTRQSGFYFIGEIMQADAKYLKEKYTLDILI